MLSFFSLDDPALILPCQYLDEMLINLRSAEKDRERQLQGSR